MSPSMKEYSPFTTHLPPKHMEDPLLDLSLPKAFHDCCDLPTNPQPNTLRHIPDSPHRTTNETNDNATETIIQSTHEPVPSTQQPMLEENTIKTTLNILVRRSTRTNKQPSYQQAYHCSLLIVSKIIPIIS